MAGKRVLKNRKPFRAIWELKIIHKRRRAMRLFSILAVQFCLVVWSFGSAGAYNLPDTGLTKCYQNVYPYVEITCDEHRAGW